MCRQVKDNIQIVLLCAAVALLGALRSVAVPLGALPDDATVLSVNGFAVTKRDYVDYQKMMVALYRNRHPGANQDRMRTARARIGMAARSELVSRFLMYSSLCAGTNAVEVIPAAREMLEKDYCSAFAHRGQDFEDLREAMADEGVDAAFERSFSNDVKVRSALMSRHPESFRVSDEEVSNAVVRVVTYNRIADATNALICATMTNVLGRIRAGEDFAKLADSFSQDPGKEPGGDLGECDLATFNGEDPDYIMAVSRLKPGEVSGILETESGYEIVRKAADIPKEKSESGNESWRLSRIFFQRPYYMPDPEEKSLRERILKEKREKLVEGLMAEYLKTAEIKVFVDEMSDKSKQPAKKQKKGKSK